MKDTELLLLLVPAQSLLSNAHTVMACTCVDSLVCRSQSCVLLMQMCFLQQGEQQSRHMCSCFVALPVVRNTFALHYHDHACGISKTTLRSLEMKVRAHCPLQYRCATADSLPLFRFTLRFARQTHHGSYSASAKSWTTGIDGLGTRLRYCFRWSTT